MKFILALVFALGIATSSAFAQITVNTPASAVVCQPLLLTWSGGTPPYAVSILPGNQPGGAAFVTSNPTSETLYTWLVDVTVGTSLVLEVRDSTGRLGQSPPFSVQAGALSTSDSSCVGLTTAASLLTLNSSSPTSSSPLPLHPTIISSTASPHAALVSSPKSKFKSKTPLLAIYGSIFGAPGLFILYVLLYPFLHRERPASQSSTIGGLNPVMSATQSNATNDNGDWTRNQVDDYRYQAIQSNDGQDPRCENTETPPLPSSDNLQKPPLTALPLPSPQFHEGYQNDIDLGCSLSTDTEKVTSEMGDERNPLENPPANQPGLDNVSSQRHLSSPLLGDSG